MASNPSFKLYSVYYKPFPLLPKAEYVIPIQAGAAVHAPLQTLGDNTGNHISDLNNYYVTNEHLLDIPNGQRRHTEALGLVTTGVILFD